MIAGLSFVGKDLKPGMGADVPARTEPETEYGDSINFQKVESFTPPQWPGQEVPQQMHLDLVVDDLDEAEAAVLELGATKLEPREPQARRGSAPAATDPPSS